MAAGAATPVTMAPLLDLSAAERFYDGRLAAVRLNHPEGLAVDERDGALWCGGEQGELYRIAPDGRTCELRAKTGGYALGLWRGRTGRMFMCDWGNRCIAVFSPDGRIERQLRARDGAEELQLPNHGLLSSDERYYYCSDTRPNGPGIWRFDLETGETVLWMREPCRFANGLGMAPDGSAVFLVESYRPGVTRVPILADGRAGPKTAFIELPGDVPDGLAFDHLGRLYISIWHPSRIYRWSEAHGLELLIEDPALEVFHHPTNIAFRGSNELFAANLGGWHLTRVDLSRLAARTTS